MSYSGLVFYRYVSKLVFPEVIYIPNSSRFFHTFSIDNACVSIVGSFCSATEPTGAFNQWDYKICWLSNWYIHRIDQYLIGNIFNIIVANVIIEKEALQTNTFLYLQWLVVTIQSWLKSVCFVVYFELFSIISRQVTGWNCTVPDSMAKWQWSLSIL